MKIKIPDLIKAIDTSPGLKCKAHRFGYTGYWKIVNKVETIELICPLCGMTIYETVSESITVEDSYLDITEKLI